MKRYRTIEWETAKGEAREKDFTTIQQAIDCQFVEMFGELEDRRDETIKAVDITRLQYYLVGFVAGVSDRVLSEVLEKYEKHDNESQAP